MLIGGIPRSKNLIWRRKNRKYASRLLSLVASSRVHSNKISTATPMFFAVQLFNGVVDDDTGSRVLPEINMAGNQTYMPR